MELRFAATRMDKKRVVSVPCLLFHYTGPEGHTIDRPRSAERQASRSLLVQSAHEGLPYGCQLQKCTTGIPFQAKTYIAES